MAIYQINIIFFIIEFLSSFLLNTNIFLKNFSFSIENVKNGLIWSLISYIFINDLNLLYFFLNLIIIFFIEKILEIGHTKKIDIICSYLFSALIGSIIFIIFWKLGIIEEKNKFKNITGSSPSIFGLLIICSIKTKFNKNLKISFWIFLLKKIYLLLIFTQFFNIILLREYIEEKNIINYGIYITKDLYILNIGGFLGPFFYFFLKRFLKKIIIKKELIKKINKNSIYRNQNFKFLIDNSNSHFVMTKLQSIIKKIKKNGFKSLSKNEIRVLKKIKKKYF
jgi:hypothetical protein